jgi:hypothetical protein
VASRTKWHAFIVALCLAFAGVAAARSRIDHPPGTSPVGAAVGRARAQLAAQAPLGELRSGRAVRVSGRSFSPHAAIVVAQCGTAALAAALTSVQRALDDCDEDFVAVRATGPDGSFTVRARAMPTIQTASGEIDCRRRGACLLGALNLAALQGQPLQVAVLPLAFSPTATAPSPHRGTGRPLSETYGTPPVTAKQPARAVLDAYPAGDLGAGRAGLLAAVPTRALPRRRLRGEGLLALTMSAPETSWGDPADTSVVVQARVDRGAWQQIVLFEGAAPFTYEGFTGPLATGRHVVTVRVRPALSHVTRHPPMAVVVKESLAVVSPRQRAGVQLAHAPVLYGRSVSTTRDTPLETYATDEAQVGHPGLRRLTYVVVWSHEDAGTGFVPWLEWGTWGRMTDIETAITFLVDRRGRVSRPTYLTCVTCGVHFPSNRTALDETEAPFRGRWFHGHPVLRVATGNNDLSDRGTTALRFQQALAAPPPDGDTREGAMDRNPWSYTVMGQELARDRADYSTSAGSAGPGDPQQYLTVALDTVPQGVSAVGVDIRLAGSATTYSNDLGTTYPLYRGGNGRTVVKVPLTRVGRPITLLRLRVLGASSALTVDRVRVLQYVHGRIVVRRAPPPLVVSEPSPTAAGPGPPSMTASAAGS